MNPLRLFGGRRGNVTFWIKDTRFGVRFAAFSQGGAREKLLDWPCLR